MFQRFFDWIKSFFTSEGAPNTPQITQPDPVETQPEIEPEKPSKSEEKPDQEEQNPVLSKSKKIALIVGHTQQKPGAKNYLGESEWFFNDRIAKKVKEIMAEKYPAKKVKIFYRGGGNYNTAVKEVGKKVGKFKADISMELHFNSFKQKAYGCEILVYNGKGFDLEPSLRAADKITDDLAQKFNLRERGTHRYDDNTYGDGVKILGGRDRGGLNLKAVVEHKVKVVMLIEPCFANIEHGESRAIFENEDAYAELLAKSLAEIDC